MRTKSRKQQRLFGRTWTRTTSSEGTFTLPPLLRDKLGISSGTKVSFIVTDDNEFRAIVAPALARSNKEHSASVRRRLVYFVRVWYIERDMKYLQSKPTIAGSDLTIKGTRIRITQVFRMLASGMTIAYILEGWPWLSAETLHGAMEEAIKQLEAPMHPTSAHA